MAQIKLMDKPNLKRRSEKLKVNNGLGKVKRPSQSLN